MTPLATTIFERLQALARPGAEQKARFFKAGPGEYAEGDQFFNVEVPQQRALAKDHASACSLDDLADLLASPWHECRLTALLILVLQAKKASPEASERIVTFYEARFDRINNWDLVDTSAPQILGPWYWERDRAPLFLWAASPHLWSARIGIMTTQHFIRSGDFSTTLALAERLLGHPHDLIHKAVGWMLREVGNRSLETEEAFLKEHYRVMPRTMLRYAIEKFPKERYDDYLHGRVN